MKDKEKLKKLKLKYEKMHRGRPKGGKYLWDEKETKDEHRPNNNS